MWDCIWDRTQHRTDSEFTNWLRATWNALNACCTCFSVPPNSAELVSLALPRALPLPKVPLAPTRVVEAGIVAAAGIYYWF
jgi:hypothetical protein